MQVTSVTPTVTVTPTGYAETLLTLQHERGQRAVQRQRLDLELEQEREQEKKQESRQQRTGGKSMNERRRSVLTIIDGGIKLPA